MSSEHLSKPIVDLVSSGLGIINFLLGAVIAFAIAVLGALYYIFTHLQS